MKESSRVESIAKTELIFKEVSLVDKVLFDEYLQAREYELSVFSFCSIFLWRQYFTFAFKIINESLCIFAKNDVGVFMYIPPMSKILDGTTIETCFDLMCDINGSGKMSRIENIPCDQLSSFCHNEYSVVEKCNEYCYEKDDIVFLKGKQYKSKRHDKNLFLRRHDPQYLPFISSMVEDCVSVYASWSDYKKVITRMK